MGRFASPFGLPPTTSTPLAYKAGGLPTRLRLTKPGGKETLD